jgi:transposase
MRPLPDEWKEEIARLRAERDAASRSVSALQASLDQLTRMVAGQNERLDQLVSMLRRREAQVKLQEAELRKLRRKLGIDDADPDPPSTDTPPPPGGSPTTNADSPSTGDGARGSRDRPKNEASPNSNAADAEPQKPADGSPDGATSPERRPRSRGGRRPPPEHLDAECERHNVTSCGACGGRVFKRDVLSTEVYTVVLSHVRRRVIRRERVICADPDCHVATTARMPPMPTERALYDCRFLAWIVVMKFVLLVPLDRIHHFLLAQGVDIAMGSLVGLVERAADLVAPIDGEHLRQLRAGSYFHFDGTGLKTLVVGQEHAWDGYLEVFTRNELTVFQFDMTKHADRLQERINDFVGILLCDAESRNGAGFRGGTLAYCNAHPRRKFRDAELAQPRLAVQGARFIQALYELEDQATLLGLTGKTLLEFRQRRSGRVLHRFRQWLEGVVARPLPPSDPVRKAAKYYIKHFDGLTQFLHHAELPLDNNPAEREFQRHAKLRQASLFAGSPEGAHRWAILLGVVRTAQKCELDVQAYLTWVFERRGSHRNAFGMSASELTPMAYRAQVTAPEVRSSA